jgi:hypothetical protein
MVEGALTRSSSTDTPHMKVPTPQGECHQTRIWKKLRRGLERKDATGHLPAPPPPPPEKHVLDKGELLDTVSLDITSTVLLVNEKVDERFGQKF